MSPLRSRTLAALATTALIGAGTLAPATAASPTTDRAPASARKVPEKHFLTPVMPTNDANPDNPLAGHRWGTYGGLADPAWKPYVKSSGHTHKLLAQIAKPPKAKWFGSWIPDRSIGKKVRQYLSTTTHGDQNVLAQLTMARVQPWETEACKRLPRASEKKSYQRYVDAFVKAIGSHRTAVVVEPDGPFARCAPHHSKVYSHLIRGTVKKLGRLPHTSVYIEMGSADWFRDKPHDAVQLLLNSGIGAARGFALDTTHYDSTARQIAFGTRMVRLLGKQGAQDKHFVIDTADNGRGFSGKAFHHNHGSNGILAQAPVCHSKKAHHCVTLGIRPTTDVANRAWHLTSKQRAEAASHVDGYLWVSRPWLDRPSQRWSLKRALNLVRTSPF